MSQVRFLGSLPSVDHPAITDPAGSRRTLAYDRRVRRISLTDPDSGTLHSNSYPAPRPSLGGAGGRYTNCHPW